VRIQAAREFIGCSTAGLRRKCQEPLKKGHVRDDQTGSIWNRATGIAVEGPLTGKRLEPHVGIMSYSRAWLTFHPESKEVTR
jgi:hypothetical protein